MVDSRDRAEAAWAGDEADVRHAKSHARAVLFRTAHAVSTANILAAGKEDFTANNRLRLFSRIATANWDAVIVTHSSFEKIPVSLNTRRNFIAAQIDEIETPFARSARSRVRRLERIGAREEATYCKARSALRRWQERQHADIRRTRNRSALHR